MTCYLVRHGKDDDAIRGGWNTASLTEEGVAQALALAEYIEKNRPRLAIRYLYASDLVRAKETVSPIAERLELPVTFLPAFREVNNGRLAGMKNELANEQYPGLFWNTLDWEQAYPDGESPKNFYDRIRGAWEKLAEKLVERGENALLVTHGGVINVILSLIRHEKYSNKDKPRRIPHATLIALSFMDGEWREETEI